MSTKREYSLDFLKTAASVLIVFHHYQQCVPGEYRICFFPGPGLFSYGYMVELFFMISGFLIAGYEARIRQGLGFRDYFLRRYLRLFPLMLLSTAVYCALYFLLGLDSLPDTKWMQRPTLAGFALTALGLQRGWGLSCPNINNPLWYLSVLIFCYLLFYLLVRAAERLHAPAWPLYLLMVLIGVGCRRLDLPFLNSWMCRGYRSFFLGLLLAALLRGRRPGALAAGICALIAAAITLLIPRYPLFALIQTVNYVYFPAILLLFLSEPVSKCFRSPLFGFLGKASFDVYVWHLCGILIVLALSGRGLLDPAARPLKGMLLFTVCCFLFGILSHLFIETPCARLTDRLLRREAGK